MKSWKLVSGVAIAVVTVVGTAVALAGPRFRGAEDLGLKAYWSVLNDTQKEQAKGIAADYLAETAPDRLATGARIMRFRADVATVLTVEQRKQVAANWWAGRGRTPEEKGARLEHLLASMDRGAVADRVERMETATPEQRVTLAIELFDQFWAAAEPKVATDLKLTDDQLAKIRALAANAKSDVRPVAVRVATAKEQAKAKGLAILDESQRKRLDDARVSGRARLMAFIRGTN